MPGRPPREVRSFRAWVPTLAPPDRARTTRVFDARMGGRKSAGRGGRGGRGRGSSGGRGRGRGGGGYGGGGRGGWGGEARQGHRGGGIYGPPESERLAFAGGGPKRKHRQMRDAYGPRAGGRRVRRPDDDDTTTDTSDDDLDHPSEYVDDSSEDEQDADDPNVDQAHVMRVGGIEIRLDRGADDRENPRGTPIHPRDPSDDDDSDDDDDWGSELSLDDDAIADYMQNCMNDDDDDDDENESGAAAAASGGDDAPMDPVSAAERRRARQAAYLAGMRAMRLDAGDVPSPPLSPSGSDSDSEAENDALVNGNYGAYSWSRGAGAGGSRRDPERLGPSGKRAAKKAAKAARRRGESPDGDEGLPRPAVVAETLRMMILSGGAYVGFQPARSASALRGLARIADAFGLRAELRGGGKRRHPVVVWTPRARVPRADDRRVARAVAEAGGGEYRPGGNWEGYAAEGRGGGRDGDGDRDFASNFVSGGVMRHDDAEGEDEDDEGVEGVEGVGAERTMEMETDAAVAIETDPPMERDVRDGGDEARDDDDVNDDDGGGVDAISAEAADGDALGGGADPRSNRGLRRAAEAAERERRTLESRRRKLGIATGGGDAKGKGKRVVAAGHGFGEFEKHTSGFGSRMLAKMGFAGEGSGVGKGGTGIAEPITAEVRARRVGLGAERR